MENEKKKLGRPKNKERHIPINVRLALSIVKRIDVSAMIESRTRAQMARVILETWARAMKEQEVENSAEAPK